MSDPTRLSAEKERARIHIQGFCYALVDHCNLACHGCDHDSPLAPPRFTALDQFERDLRALSEVLHAHDLRLGGGEPLLHPHVEEFFEVARACRVADRLTLVTNGLMLHKARPRLWKLIDGVYLSVYPDVHLPEPLSAYASLAEQHGVYFDSADQTTFVHTLLNQKVDDPLLVAAVYRLCKMTGEWWCHTVHEGRYYKCSIAPFCGRRMARLGVDYRPGADSVSLHASPDLRAELARYLARREPLAACAYCLGTSGPGERHRILDRSGVEAWWKEDHSQVIAAVRTTLIGPCGSPLAGPAASRYLTTVPRVSVMIPCFNQGQFLDEAVNSVLAQTIQDFEILIVDDGSTDPETVSRVAESRYPRTRVWRTPNRGLPAARNFLISQATGTFLCALDADDRLHPEYFAKALQRFDDDPGLTFVSSWIQEFGTHDGIWRQDRCDLAALLTEDTVMTAALVRRDVVVALGGYDEKMPAQGDEDWDLWIRVVKDGHRGTIIPETLFYYRRRPGSISTICTRGQVHLDLVRYLFRKHEHAYRSHLRDVMRWQDRRVAEALRTSDALERERNGGLMATVELLRAERERLIRRLELARVASTTETARPETPAIPVAVDAQPDDALTQLAALQAEYGRALDEAAALRASTSWRLTGPLRRVYDAWLGLRSGRRR
jgi:glycosyltransferase involved in cell wall biosynthesis